MPRPLNIDWNTAKALYLKGYTIEQVALTLGIKPNTVKLHAHRHGWTRDAVAVTDAVTQVVSQAVTLSLAERGATWGERVANIVERQLVAVERKTPDKLKLSEFETLTRILANTDATARRTFGLDKPDASRQAAVGIKVNLRIDTAGCQAATPQAVDAEVVDDDSK